MVLKPSHWSKELKEITLVTAKDGVFNFRIVGGSDHGEFPVISEVMPPDTRGVEYSVSPANPDATITTQVSDISCHQLLVNLTLIIINCHSGFIVGEL